MALLWAACAFGTFALINAVPTTNTKPTKDDVYWGLDKFQEEYKLPTFPYSMDAFEPHIDKNTMEIHYNAIFKQYTEKLNILLKEWRNSKNAKHEKSLKLAKGSLVDMWRSVNEIPDEFKKEFMYNAGGYLNHLIYFATMSPNKEDKAREPTKEFAELIEHSFHNLTLMMKDFNESTTELFGTGWVYLVRATGRLNGEYLTIMSTLEEMIPLDNKRIFPILACDVWEHAYFRKYKNNRAQYVRNWWKIVDWVKVERLLNWWRILVPTIPPPTEHTDL